MSRAHWLALSTTPGLGGVTVRKLLERFGDVKSVFAAAPAELASVPRVTRAMAERVLAAPIDVIEEELLSLSDEGIDLLTWDDERFPAALAALADSPVILFMRGELAACDVNAVALVGTRDPTPAGVLAAESIAREFATRGLTVVSGLAFGIDTAAHRGALAVPRGRTLGVLGSGIRVIHPAENAELAAEIVRRGALLSELHPNAPPRGPQLMARNRIVSGLSRAVIVVEASAQSGSLDTAARAAKQGRLVYAVPGSAGTGQLLAAGMRRLELDRADFDSLADDIRRHSPAAPPPTPQQGALL